MFEIKLKRAYRFCHIELLFSCHTEISQKAKYLYYFCFEILRFAQYDNVDLRLCDFGREIARKQGNRCEILSFIEFLRDEANTSLPLYLNS